MILITGTFLSKEELPNSEMMDYQIDNEHMDIKLKTVAKQSICFEIYIAEDRKTYYTVTDDIIDKIKYFKDDDDLLNQLNRGSNSNPEDVLNTPVEPAEPEPELPQFEPVAMPEVKEDEEPERTNDGEESNQGEDKGEDSDGGVKETEGVKEEKVEEKPKELEIADTELPEEIFQIPNLTDDTDSLKEQIKVKDRIIEQKDGMIKDLQKNIDDTYKVQEIQLLELEKSWTDKMTAAEQQIEELKNRVAGGALSDEANAFLRYVNYAQTYKAVSNESFSEADKKRLGKLSSPFKIFASGTGDSCYSMLKYLKSYMEKPNGGVVIVDFSNDNFLIASYNLKKFEYNSLGLFRDDIDVSNIAIDLKGNKKVRYMPTTNFNDISFLIADWVNVIKKIDDFAGGKPVIMLFGGINSFNVRNTVSKLSSLNNVDLYIFAKCSPIILGTLYSDIQFIPRERITLIASEYIDVVKTMLSSIAQRYNVIAVAKDMDWNKIGL